LNILENGLLSDQECIHAVHHFLDLAHLHMTALPEVPPLLQGIPLLLSQLLGEAHLIKEKSLLVLARNEGLLKLILGMCKQLGRVQFLFEGGNKV
jgi:hypothetical protein